MFEKYLLILLIIEEVLFLEVDNYLLQLLVFIFTENYCACFCDGLKFNFIKLHRSLIDDSFLESINNKFKDGFLTYSILDEISLKKLIIVEFDPLLTNY